MNSYISSSDLQTPGSVFLRWFVVWLVGGAALVAGWNYLVNPFEMYHSWTLAGFNHVKAGNVGAYDRMAKAKEIAVVRPNGLLLGTSRVDLGMEPGHPYLQSISPDFYNAGLAGATIYEVRRYLQHAHALRPVRHAIIGLDLEMFIAGRARDTFREGRLAAHPDGSPNPWFHFADLMATLFSRDALEASAATLRMSRRYRQLSPHLLRQRGNPLTEELDDHSRWELYKLGLRQARTNLGRLAQRRERITDQFGHFDDILAWAHREEVDIALFITPYHLTHLEVLRASSGGWETFEWWKRELSRRNTQAATRAGRQAFPLWDFSGYHTVATEPVPTPKNFRRIMHWYRESSHYRKRTGDLMLDRISGLSYPDVPVRGFGVPLHGDNLDGVLEAQRQLRDRWVERWRPPDS